MRVAAFGNVLTLSSGYARDIRGLLTGLQQLGHDVLQFGLEHVGPPLEYLPGIPVYEARTTGQVAQALRATHPDVLLHVRDNWSYIERFQRPSYHLLPICQAAGTRLVSMTPVQSAPVPDDLVGTIETEADLTVVQANWELEQLVAQGAPSERLRMLEHGVDPAVYHPGPADRASLGFPDGKMLLTVASNTDRKNLPGSMLLLSKFLKLGVDDAFLYLHAPAETGYYHLDCHADALGLSGKNRVFLAPFDEGNSVTLHGLSETAIADLYRTADVYVAPTFSEGFGVPILEALASGLPAVVTDTPILRELFGSFPHARFMPAVQEMPTNWGWDWFPDTTAGAELAIDALRAGKPSSVEVPDRFKWPNIVGRLEGFLEELCPNPHPETPPRKL